MNSVSIIKLAFLFVIFCNAVVDVAHKVLLQNIAFKIFDGSEQVVWVSIINALIIIPFILLFSISGYLSDRYNKKDILVYGAVSSFVLSALMVFSYLSGNFYLAMINLLLLAVQSAIYSPAKYGIILDIWGKKNLSKGNSALQAISIIAILFSISIASYVFESFYISNNLQSLRSKEELLDAIMPLTLYIVPVGFLEMVFSIFILRKLKTSYSKQQDISLDKDELLKGKLLAKNMKHITSHSIIFLCVLALCMFWAISQGYLATFPAYAKEYLQITDVFLINTILATSGIGIAVGSYFYSKLSKHYIEVGTIPMASFAMAFMIYLSIQVESIFVLSVCFFLFGFFGGLYVVPLNSLIQFNANKKILGTILAGNNWFQSVAMFLMLALTTTVSLLSLDPKGTLYLIFFIILFGAIYTVVKLPQSMILLFLKLIVGVKYDIEVFGIKNIPNSGGVLFLGNHISWIDWAIILMSCPREVKFVIYKPIYNKWYLTWIFKLFKAIPISNASSKTSIELIAKELDDGNAVVLFPEGAITRNGHLGEFKKGFEKILELTNNDVKVISFYIRGLWESMFSRANNKFKRTSKTSRVSVSFSLVISKQDATTTRVKNEITKLSRTSWSEHIQNLGTLSEVVFDRLKEVGSDFIFADSTGVELSGDRFLTASILFKNRLKKEINEQNVGLLLPSTAAGAFVNYSILLMGKTVVNINYTSQVSQIEVSLKKAEVKTIISSKNFIDKLQTKGIDLKPLFDNFKIILLEDVKKQISKSDGVVTLMLVKFLPVIILKNIFMKKIKKDDTVAILFSSGSEGEPKGIELTSDNILGNAKQIAGLINANDNDIVVGSLPIFHAFGITVTTFLPLIEGIKCVAHPDPTDGVGIGKLVAKYKATFMTGTSTFFRLYTKNAKVHPLMFESLRLVIAGAEKLREDVRADFKKKFGKEIYEGYGVTETTPVASCNIPDTIGEDFEVKIGSKYGSVGMAIPGTEIKIVDPNSFEELKVGEEGMILISGIQVMKGYLKDKEKTAQVLKEIKGNTYYVTGDKGRIDQDGFLTIVDRYSRFAKLGGEMISLGSVEENISKILLGNAEDSEIDFIATSVEDEKKGEKIILLISNINDDGLALLKDNILKKFDNKLMIPSSYFLVDEIPKLGTGKKDFNKAKQIALDLSK